MKAFIKGEEKKRGKEVETAPPVVAATPVPEAEPTPTLATGSHDEGTPVQNRGDEQEQARQQDVVETTEVRIARLR